MSLKFLSKKVLVATALVALFSSTCPVAETAPAKGNIPPDALSFRGHHYYVFSNVGRSWEESQRFCESMGGHLATIADSAENYHLYSYMKTRGYSSAYFGLVRDGYGKWRWVTGEPVTFTNWHPGEPNNSGGKERYGMFYWKFKYTWNDGNYGKGTQGDSPTIICEWDY